MKRTIPYSPGASTQAAWGESVKLVRYTADVDGPVRAGILDAQGRIRSLGSHMTDIDCETLKAESLAALRRLDPSLLDVVEGNVTLTYPVRGIGKIIGVGLNHKKHALETKLPLPDEATLFLKPSSSLAGPNADIIKPPGSKRLDWEIELGVVIGRHGVHIKKEDALSHVAAYCIGIDFSERDVQFNRGGQGLTPAGVGLGCDPQVYLEVGDHVGAFVNGLGSQRYVIKERAAQIS
jgi:2-keto-4-pentenoate hydratase/2-oxohepta-3-ene-1,7-dioic acid hydratase in catechol pathway